MQGLENKVADGNCEMLANSMNDLFVSVSEHLPRLNVYNEVFTVEGELPDECIISVQPTGNALRNIKTNKASGPDNTPAWVLKYHAALLAPPLTAILIVRFVKVNFQMNGRWLKKQPISINL